VSVNVYYQSLEIKSNVQSLQIEVRDFASQREYAVMSVIISL